MNYNDILQRLSTISSDEYEFEARLLVEAFTDKKISYIMTHRSEDIESEALTLAIARRENREPIQYILGKWDFYRQSYVVDENCLIPRADTEILVEKAIELLPTGARFVDLCTGSGCIAISILCERSDLSAVMVDKFEKTLALAKRNSDLNGVSDRVDPMLFDVLTEDTNLDTMSFDAIISNPPYIRPEVIETLAKEVRYEPYAALCGGDDGLIFYRKIVSDYSRFLKKDGFFLFEIGYDQAEQIKEIAEDNGFSCDIVKDYSANDRVAILKK